MVDFTLVFSLQSHGWGSGDGKMMLGLPNPVFLWAGAVPGGEVGSREPLAGGPVGWSQDAFGEQAGKWGLWEGWLKREGYKGQGQEMLGMLAGLSEAG